MPNNLITRTYGKQLDLHASRKLEMHLILNLKAQNRKLYKVKRLLHRPSNSVSKKNIHQLGNNDAKESK